MKPLYLPAITGQFANWRYFQLVVPVREIVQQLTDDQGQELFNEKGEPIYRVRSVAEVDEIYSKKGIGYMLQRVFDIKRLEPITNYMTQQTDKYVNNLTVAVYGGEPEWLPIGLSGSTLMDLDERHNAVYWEEFGKSFGVIKLTGKEVLFVLDGQHRVMGFREAVKKDAALLDQQVAITLVAHGNDSAGRERTRRLFTTINRYAKPVSQGESILLDEDDVSSIVARKVIEEYHYFKGRQLIALNKQANLNLPQDSDKFSTVIALWSINELIISHDVYPAFEGPKKNMVRVRPEDSVIDREAKRVFEFWDLFFSCFPKAKEFVSDPENHDRGSSGPFSLRPIGQQVFADIYIGTKGTKGFDLRNIKKVPDDLSNRFWHHVLWNPERGTMLRSRSMARDYLLYHLGFPLSKAKLNKLREDFRKNAKDETAKLPSALFKPKTIRN